MIFFKSIVKGKECLFSVFLFIFILTLNVFFRYTSVIIRLLIFSMRYFVKAS